MIEKELLTTFKSIYDKQSQLRSLTNEELFREYSNSEVHTIEIIGQGPGANGVMIANKLNMTRGAISKIIGRLMDKGLVESYQLESNKKEIYYKLSSKGNLIYRDHEIAHKDWENRELNFFKSLGDSEKEIMNGILKNYESHLKGLIEERS